MELRHLLYFKTVAEELHFRHAANKLFISQPPLSRQIKELEEELGATLFTRNNKRVELTPAGLYFKKEVDQLFRQLEESKQVLKQIHGGVSGQLRIGYISSTYHPHLSQILQELRQVFPFVKTKLYEVPTAKQVKALEEGRLDVGIMRAPVQSERLTVRTLFQDSFVVVLPAGEASFAQPQELASFLQQQPFIFFNQDYAPQFYRQLIDICQRMGFMPEIVHEANSVHSILQLVESGLGVTVLPASVQESYARLNVSFYPLAHLPISTEVVLAYKASAAGQHPAVNWFLDRYGSLFQLEIMN